MKRSLSYSTIFCLQLLSIIALLSGAYAQEIRLSKNNRYLTDKKGKSFLWIGDTAWELFHKLSRNDAEMYLRTREKQQFTVIQAAILAEDDGLKKPNYDHEVPFIDLDPAQPNEAYFKHVDYIIETANRLGLTMALLPTWADKVPSDRPGNGPIVFNTNNAYNYGKFLGKRYRNNKIVWILGGDRNVNEQSIEIWRSMAMGLKAGDKGNHLISYHPAGEQSSSSALQAENWLNFNCYQSGHARKFFPVYKMAASDYAKKPVKPFIDAEPCYEDIPVEFWKYMDATSFDKGHFTDYDLRISNYRNLLAGAFGITYGNNAVWQFYDGKKPAIIPCLFDWKASLYRPGALQLRHLKKVLKNNILASLTPSQQSLRNNPESEELYVSCAKTNTELLAYLPQGGRVEIPEGKYYKHLNWFNPKTGTFLRSRNIKCTDFYAPSQGIGEDWLLLMKK